MAIDTRYVAIVPRFDTRAFNNIKKKIEGIGKGLSEIKVGYKLNSRSLAGLKTALNSQIKNGNFLISVPVTYKKPSLSGLKSELKTSIADGKHSLKYPVTFSIIGAKTKLLADLKGKKFSSIKVPVKFSLVGAKKELVSKLKASSFAAVKLPTVFSLKGAKKQLKLDIEALINKRIRIPVDIIVRDGSRVGTGGSGGGSNRGGGFGSRITGAAVNTGAYAIAGGAIFGSQQAIVSGARSAYDLETNLLYMKSVYDATIGGIDSSELDSIKNKVLETAAKFPITVNQASEAMRILAKNGANVNQIMGGMFDEAVISSLALRTDIGITADFMTDIARTFKLNKDEFGRLSKTLVGTTFSSKFDVQDVWYAFAQGSGQASASGLTPEEYGALLISAQATAKTGRDLGTQLKNLLRFFTVPKSKKSQSLMKQYGLDAFDDKGNVTNVKEWVTQLSKLTDLTDKDRLQVINEIFGSDASKGAIEIMNKGLKDFAKNLGIIENTNVKSAVETQMSGIAGAIDKVKSKWQDLFNTVVNQDVVDASTTSLSKFGDVLTKLKEGYQLFDTVHDMTHSNIMSKMDNLDKTLSNSKLYTWLRETANFNLTGKGSILNSIRDISPFGTSIEEAGTINKMKGFMSLDGNINTKHSPITETFLQSISQPVSSQMSTVNSGNLSQEIHFHTPIDSPEQVAEAIKNVSNRGSMLDNDSALNNSLIYLN